MKLKLIRIGNYYDESEFSDAIEFIASCIPFNESFDLLDRIQIRQVSVLIGNKNYETRTNK